MPPKADTPAPPIQPAETGVSGKFLIIGIFAVALIAAGGSWLFRYNATHHSAAFWGRWDTWLIRDGWFVELLELRPTDNPTANSTSDKTVHFQGAAYLVSIRQDVTHSPGLVHLRNALLEDMSFNWPAHRVDHTLTPRWALQFTHEKESAQLLFTEDCTTVTKSDYRSNGMSVSCQPISKGLQSVFKEWIAGNSIAPAESAVPAR